MMMWVLQYTSDMGNKYYWDGRTWVTNCYQARLYHNWRSANRAKRAASPYGTQWYVPYDQVNLVKADWT